MYLYYFFEAKLRHFLFVQFYTACLLYSCVISVRTGQADRGINAPLWCIYTSVCLTGFVLWFEVYLLNSNDSNTASAC